MNDWYCNQESAVTRAARSGHWPAELESHAAACTSCKRLVATLQAMRSIASPSSQEASEAPAQDATRLWCLALIERKRAEAARARRMMAVVELATFTAVAAVSAGWITWNWSQISVEMGAQFSSWQSALAPELWRAAWFLVERMPLLASLPAVSLLLLLAGAAVLLAQPLLAED